MKNLLKRTWWRAVLVSLAILLLSGGIVYAAYYGISRTISASVTVAQVITLPSEVIGVYSDAAGTANVTSLNFGELAPWGGARTSVKVYVKNHSDNSTVAPEPVTLYISVYSQNFPYGYVSVQEVYNEFLNRWEYPTLLPGEIKQVQLNLYVYGGVPSGSHSFTVVIEGRGVTAPSAAPQSIIVPEEPAPAQ